MYKDNVDTGELTEDGLQSRLDASYHLLPYSAITEAAKVLREGATKYGARNWTKIPCEDHVNHALHHLFAFIESPNGTDISHALCRVMFALHTYYESPEEKDSISLPDLRKIFD